MTQGEVGEEVGKIVARIGGLQRQINAELKWLARVLTDFNEQEIEEPLASKPVAETEPTKISTGE